ncbi:MAG: anthranilate phosphoribosyltransferase [Rickettsiales bacterium]|nr:anthranilate phosphoribosyltransferase [Rickettsiales bacterium]
MSFKNFTHTQFEQIFSNIIEQKISAAETKKILLQINDEGFSTQVFLGVAAAFKKRMIKIHAPENAIDVCGTGGDKLNTLNVSTAVCFVVAAAGATVAKHGNKAISSNSGSADIFSELNIAISSDVAAIEKTLREKKLCFLFAPFFHESLKSLAVIRKEIAQEFNVPTIFNYLGPLLNPANTSIQLIGTSKKETMLPMLEALKIMGSKRVYIVHGFDGMDEITLCDNSYLMRLEEEKITEEIIDPTKFGFAKVGIDALKGKDPKHNAQKLIALLDGEKSAYRDIVILNSAFALRLSQRVKTVEEGIAMARSVIDGGSALDVLRRLKS